MPILQPHDEAAVTELVEIRDITDEIEHFLLTQLSRFETEMDRITLEQGSPNLSGPEGRGAEAVERQLRELIRERDAWEAQREEEAERLHKDAALLRDAWKKYEDEQRRFLAEKELLRRGVGVESRPPLAAPSSAPSPVASSSSEDSLADKQSAWRQFQRMRREIQTRARPKS